MNSNEANSFNCKLCPVNPPFHLHRRLCARESLPPCALTIGNFDGVHRGHQAILSRVRQEALPRGLTPTVMTFEPHPRDYFAQLAGRPELAPARIFSLRDKVVSLASAGIARVIAQRFDAALASMPAPAFIEDLLAARLNTRWLLVGEDFRVGHRRGGDIDTLRQAGRRHGFEVHTLADVADSDGRRISSSEARAALAAGDLPRAAHLLGHPYRMSGHVIHGRKLGRALGFPTLNLRVTPRCAARSGVYVVRVSGLTSRPDQMLPGVASLGARPTVHDNGRVLLETHLLELPSPAAAFNAYGKIARVEFLHWLRDEEKFSGLDTLTAAIAQDARDARAWFAAHGMQPLHRFP
jgi:riboflavin kinase/FMN adenylyltransferase